MVDDQSANPALFPTEKAQEEERDRLFDIIRELVKWENTTNETVLERAREEIWESWRRTCSENAEHPRAAELFDPDPLPAFHDPFAGGGALPLEAQRLGLDAYASDLNPVAVLINKAMIEIPPKFAGRPPVNPESRGVRTVVDRAWPGARGLAKDVRYYGRWMRDEAEKQIGHLYPQVEITPEMVRERIDLRSYEGRKLTVIAWLWARTVRVPTRRSRMWTCRSRPRSCCRRRKARRRTSSRRSRDGVPVHREGRRAAGSGRGEARHDSRQAKRIPMSDVWRTGDLRLHP